MHKLAANKKLNNKDKLNIIKFFKIKFAKECDELLLMPDNNNLIPLAYYISLSNKNFKPQFDIL